MRILLVDDDEILMETLAERLIKQRYAVDIAVNGEMAQEFLALFDYDVIVLDLLLPDIGGIVLCRQLRQQGNHSPILMLTAQDASEDKVQALDAGADDYVVKPFNYDELCARIRALLRREGEATTAVIQWGDLSLNPNTFEVFYGNHLLHTTPKEYALLELFLRHPDRVSNIDTIIENLWSFEDPPSGDAVRTHIKGLRQKLKAGGAPKNFIETVYGLGYRLKPLDPKVSPTEPLSNSVSSPPTPASGTQTDDAPDLKPQLSTPETPPETNLEITTAIAKAWEDHRGAMHERFSVLEATTAALEMGQLSADLQKIGRAQAHKLAGSLGCFGLTTGSRLARELENLLQLNLPLSVSQIEQVSTLMQGLRKELVKGANTALTSAAIASTPKLLMVGVGNAQKFLTESLALGIHGETVATLAEAQSCLSSQPPDGVLLWLDGAQLGEGTGVHWDEVMALLAAITQQLQPIPVVAVTNVQDFQQRLCLVQQGVARILPPSISPRQAIGVIQQMMQATRADFRVLMVDDDTQILKLVRALLLPWGFQLTTLTDATQLWNTLAAVQPHLLILDVEMPEVNGLELCQVFAC